MDLIIKNGINIVGFVMSEKSTSPGLGRESSFLLKKPSGK